jgi:hypothetical protein
VCLMDLGDAWGPDAAAYSSWRSEDAGLWLFAHVLVAESFMWVLCSWVVGQQDM